MSEKFCDLVKRIKQDPDNDELRQQLLQFMTPLMTPGQRGVLKTYSNPRNVIDFDVLEHVAQCSDLFQTSESFGQAEVLVHGNDKDGYRLTFWSNQKQYPATEEVFATLPEALAEAKRLTEQLTGSMRDMVWLQMAVRKWANETDSFQGSCGVAVVHVGGGHYAIVYKQGGSDGLKSLCADVADKLQDSKELSTEWSIRGRKNGYNYGVYKIHNRADPDELKIELKRILC